VAIRGYVRVSPSEFVESGVTDADVVADLVDHGPAYLLDNLDAGSAAGAAGSAIDGDLVGQHTAVVRSCGWSRGPIPR
jgi:hypothetical protein